MVATMTNSTWGYIHISARHPGQVRIEDSYSGKDATVIMKSLVG